eukprot:scaffold3086_cov75-Cylindrotheca_fusiformis.AAC.10
MEKKEDWDRTSCCRPLDIAGIEPATLCMLSIRAANCAKRPDMLRQDLVEIISSKFLNEEERVNVDECSCNK